MAVYSASGEHDDLSPASAQRAARTDGQAHGASAAAENHTELTAPSDPAGQLKQHQILQNRRLKESTQQYQNDHRPTQEAQEEQRPAHTAENAHQTPLVNQDLPSQPEDNGQDGGPTPAQDGVPLVPQPESLAGEAAVGGVGGDPAQAKFAQEDRDAPFVE